MIVGAWNPAILRPPWIGEHVALDNQITAEMTIGPGPVSLRYRLGDMTLTCSSDRLVIVPTRPEDGVLQAAEDAAIRILELLTHTPVTGLGVNFKFLEENANHQLLDVFDTPDRGRLADHDCAVSKTSVTRSLQSPNGVLNFGLEFDGNVVSMLANFHTEVTSTTDAVDSLRGKATRCREYFVQLLADVYGCELEEATSIEASE